MIHRPRRDPALALALALALAGVAADSQAAVSVTLRSGQTLTGASAERVGDMVLLRFPGSTLTIPAKDVVSTSGPDSRVADLAVEARQTGAESGSEPATAGQAASGERHLAAAKALMASGRYAEALQELARVPDDAASAVLVERALARATALTLLDRPAEALAALDAAPDDPRVVEAREGMSRDAEGDRVAMASTHFRVHFPDGVDRFDAAPLLDELERSHALIESALGDGPREAIVVLLYPGDTFWEATSHGSNVGGLFDGKIRVPAGRVSPPSQRLAEVLRHEVAHAFIHVISGGKASGWWHEGLAEHFEGDDIGPTLKALRAAALGGSGWPPSITHEIAHARMEWFLSRYGMSTAADVLRGMARSSEAAALRGATGLSESELVEAWRLALVEGSR